MNIDNESDAKASGFNMINASKIRRNTTKSSDDNAGGYFEFKSSDAMIRETPLPNVAMQRRGDTEDDHTNQRESVDDEE